jgi:preprotein translocase SecE subunit
MQRSQKAVSLIYLACGFIAWVLFREVFATLWVVLHLPVPEGFFASPSDILAAAIGIATFVVLVKNAKVVEFTNEVITELSKVVWPNKKETVLSTGIVCVLVAICSMILFGFDMVWGALVRVFYQ